MSHRYILGDFVIS